jgi:hypothetical protein
MTPNEQIEDPQTEIGQLSDHLREYIGVRRELFELKLWDKLFGTASAIITWAIIAFLGVICIALLSAAAAYGIGAALGKTWLGFLIVAGVYGVAAGIIYAGRDSILKKPLTDRFIERLVNEDEEDEDGDKKRTDQQQEAA